MLGKLRNFLQPLVPRRTWIPRRPQRPPLPECALPTCSPARSLWQQLGLRPRPTGVLLQGVFYCRPQCMETGLRNQLSRLHTLVPPPPPPNRIPLGLLMVARGKLTYLEVRAALEAQRRARYGKIGEWIEKLGFASEQEVTTALALQWGCPVATSYDLNALPPLGDIPLPILEAFQMLPVHYAAATNTLSIAFGERVDHAALYAIEKILDCRTQPCVAGRRNVARQIEALRQVARASDVEFGPINDLAEMARIASSYTTRLSPDQVRLSRVGRFIWLRLDRNLTARSAARLGLAARTRRNATNLVFRLPSDSAGPIPFTRPFRPLPSATEPRPSETAPPSR